MIRMVIVMDKTRGLKTAHVVDVPENKSGAFSDHKVGCDSGCEPPGASELIISSRVAPGADLLDARCTHGCKFALEYADTPVRELKRCAVDQFMRKCFGLFNMSRLNLLATWTLFKLPA
jgi:hypothetical protein